MRASATWILSASIHPCAAMGLARRCLPQVWIGCLSFPETDKINLTVNADNISALKLYKNFGFITERVMRGYRKQGIYV